MVFGISLKSCFGLQDLIFRLYVLSTKPFVLFFTADISFQPMRYGVYMVCYVCLLFIGILIPTSPTIDAQVFKSRIRNISVYNHKNMCTIFRKYFSLNLLRHIGIQKQLQPCEIGVICEWQKNKERKPEIIFISKDVLIENKIIYFQCLERLLNVLRFQIRVFSPLM